MCAGNEGGWPPGMWSRTLRRAWKTAGLPACIYLGMALGVPAVNGAFLKHPDEFWGHALTVGLVLGALVGILLTLNALWEALLRHHPLRR